MIRTGNFKMLFQVCKEAVPVFTSGIITVLLVSCVLFGIQTSFNFPQGGFSVGAAVFQHGHIHRLFTYPFYHKTPAQILLNMVALVFLSGSLEKGVGTVRFLFLFLLLSTTTGVFYSFVDLMQDDSSQSHTEGLLPVALACVALTTMHTKMTKGFLCGVSFPTMALPWVLLMITTALIPHSVLPCNIIGILVGWMHGRGWFSRLDMSEASAGALEKMMPFRLLGRIRAVQFVPASTEERRKTLLPQINPTPGSYPVQAYAPLSSVHTANTKDNIYEGWPNSTSALSSHTSPSNHHGHSAAHGFGLSHGPGSEKNLGQSCNHDHGHSHSHGHGHSHSHSPGHGHSHSPGHGHSHGQL